MLDHAKHVLNLLNEDRSSRDTLCDFVIKTCAESYPVHRCVIGIISKFFRNFFLFQESKSWNYYVFPKQFNPIITKFLVNFAYGNLIELHVNNAYELLDAATYFEIPSLQHYCKDFLIANLRPDNILKTWQYARKYCIENFVQSCEIYIAKNWRLCLDEKCYLHFEYPLFKCFIQLKGNSDLEESVYGCIVNWINHDIKKRKMYFKVLYDLIDVEKISDPFFDFIILANNFHSKIDLKHDKNEKIAAKSHMENNSKTESRRRKSDLIIPGLVKHSSTLSSAVIRNRLKLHGKLRKSLRATAYTPIFSNPVKKKKDFETHSTASHMRMMIEADEFIVIGGETTASTIKKFNVLSKNWTIFPNLEGRISIDAGLAYIQKGLFIVGGRSKNFSEVYNNVHCLEFVDQTHKCKAVANLHEKRFNFGCTVFDHKIYVAGGISVSNECLASVECYSVGRNEWEEKCSMLKMRGGCGLVCKGGVLFALGGKQNSQTYHRSVEMFNGINWRLGPAMTSKRSELAVAALHGDIYAIGGKSSENSFSNTVEKRDAVNWKFVAKLNIARAGHSACALDGKVYVVGGINNNGPVKSMEIYDPVKNVWEIFGDILGDPVGASMAPVSSFQMLSQ